MVGALFFGAVLAAWLGPLGWPLGALLAQRQKPALPSPLYLPLSELVDVLQFNHALCLRFRQRHLWLFADELGPARWAALRRMLKRALPPQALGLSMSR